MKILLLGSDGQLGKELERQLSSVGSLTAVPRLKLDITNHKALSDVILCMHPNIIVNAAAYTAVDMAETDRELAYAVNSEAVAYLAQLAKVANALLIHFSTDYVFDGTKQTPYFETDPTNPINVYGASKLAGEQAVVAADCQYLIFRAAWVIGTDGNNFAKTILKLAAERKHVNVVSDQHGVPTSAALIAKATVDAIQAVKKNISWPQGIYHITSTGTSNWHEIAQTLVGFAERQQLQLGTSVANIQAISSFEYPTSAQRPVNSQLDTSKLRTQLSFDLPHWKVDFLVVAKELIKEIKVS